MTTPFLGQSRPDGMVSDLLYELPAPAPLSRQRELSAEQARAESRRKLGQTRIARAARATSVSLSHRQARDETALQEQARLAEEKAARLLNRIRTGVQERAVPSRTSHLYGDLSPQELPRLRLRRSEGR